MILISKPWQQDVFLIKMASIQGGKDSERRGSSFYRWEAQSGYEAKCFPMNKSRDRSLHLDQDLCQNRRRKLKSKSRSRDPTYALTIAAKILYLRLKRNPVISTGVALVKHIGVCALAGMRDRFMKSTAGPSDWGTDGTSREQSKKSGPSTSAPSNNALKLGIESTYISDSSPDLHGQTSVCNLNINVNAKPATSTEQDNRPAVMLERSSSHGVPLSIRNSRRMKTKSRKVMLHRGLVARSIGGPPVRERCRGKSKAKGNLFGQPSRKSKRAMREKMLQRFSTRLKSKLAKRKSSMDLTFADSFKVTDSTERPTGQDKKVREGKGTDPSQPDTAPSKRRVVDETTDRAEANTGSSRRAKNKANKWQALLSLGNTGTPVSQKTKRRRAKKRAGDAKAKQSSSQSASRSSVTTSQAQPKVLSSETSDWPLLPAPGRSKVCAKETAEEIVRSKCSASVTKTTRKRWADIVSRGVKEAASTAEEDQAKDKKRADPAQNTKTWASVAGGRTSLDAGSPSRKKLDNQIPARDIEPTNPEETPCSAKRRRKKPGYGLAYTDRIWLTCQTSRASRHVENFYRKHYGDGKEKVLKRKGNAGSPRKKTDDKRRDRSQSVKQPVLGVSVPTSSNTETKSCEKQQTPLKTAIFQKPQQVATSADRDSKGENACLVDNMSVVYTKRAGKIINLNDSTHDRRAHKDVNKCNNRAEVSGRGVKPVADTSLGTLSQSGTDLCSQLSSMTFQTPTCSSVAVTKTSSSVSPAGKPRSPRTATGETRQKKISLRYRELLRDSTARLDARAVSDIHTRSRRADTLQEDKVVTRAMRRRARQNTTHNLRRGPAGGERSRQRTQTDDVGNFTPQRQRGHTQLRRQTHNPVTRTSKASSSGVTAIHPAPSVSETSCHPGSASSSTSTDGEVMWRPSDNNTAHNSRRLEVELSPPESATIMEHEQQGCQSTNQIIPGIAKSAPQLAEPQTNIRIDLNPSLQALDMRWWSAYLQQVKDS